MKPTTLLISTSIRQPFSWSGLFLIVLALVSFALSPTSQAVDPPPDGFYPIKNTAEGEDALFSITTGVGNTAIGFRALYNNNGTDNTAVGTDALSSNISGFFNTAIGAEALLTNTTGRFNTASGLSALQFNTTGSNNTATGSGALASNVTGINNTANGANALAGNTSGDNNTATGFQALLSNETGINNTAAGLNALLNNTEGNENAANGHGALQSNITGNDNTADGHDALFNNTTGSNNIALGHGAGSNLTTGSNNIDIGFIGVAGEANTIRIGTQGTQTKTFVAGISGAGVTGVAVKVNANGQLGTAPSSVRFKKNVKPMDKASAAIHALKPVTFHYTDEIDAEGVPQFGLVAEEVEKVSPDLVACDADGKPYTVRYEAVNAMLLNEFLKEHRQVQELERKARQHEATIAQQQKEIKALAAGLKDQAATIQKMSAQLQINKTSQLIANSR